MILDIWQSYLYEPLFNILIWIYNSWTGQNLGWAIVVLTVVLRIILLPFSVIDERNKVRNQALLDEVAYIQKQYHDDPVIEKEEIRNVLKRRKVQPWVKAIVLGIQGLVLVLLYQVFLRGITGEKIMSILYDWVEFPGIINSNFYGFELGTPHNLLWAGAVGLFLFIENYWNYRKHRTVLQKRDLSYFVLFPLFVSILLWILPAVKSLFIMTSLIFSVVIYQFSKMMFSPSAKPEEKAKPA